MGYYTPRTAGEVCLRSQVSDLTVGICLSVAKYYTLSPITALKARAAWTSPIGNSELTI